jgi:galactonate dehydratase
LYRTQKELAQATEEQQALAMGKIKTIEYFRVPPRWLFVKITDTDGNFGWGEASLEGHTQAVEGCLDAWAERYTGFEAEYVLEAHV